MQGLDDLYTASMAYAPTPEGLRVQLLPFQQQGLHFLTSREQQGDDSCAGGILADDSASLC